VWEGAAITNGAFAYNLYDAITLQGTFPGAQSASGTFRFYNHATSATAACDSGTVSWTATTTAASPSSATGHPHPGTGNPGSKGTIKATYATRVVFHRLSKARLGGRLSSPSRTCLSGRVLTLWRGSHRIATAKSHSDGSYAFARSTKVLGHRVRVSIKSRTGSTTVCAAAKSRIVTA
jgi:hypothetical protein